MIRFASRCKKLARALPDCAAVLRSFGGIFGVLSGGYRRCAERLRAKLLGLRTGHLSQIVRRDSAACVVPLLSARVLVDKPQQLIVERWLGFRYRAAHSTNGSLVLMKHEGDDEGVS
jgi:hypothetical protein